MREHSRSIFLLSVCLVGCALVPVLLTYVACGNAASGNDQQLEAPHIVATKNPGGEWMRCVSCGAYAVDPQGMPAADFAEQAVFSWEEDDRDIPMEY